MNAVPDFITASENRWMDKAESYEARIERTEAHIKAEMLDHITAGRDALRSLGKRSYPLSSFLGECSSKAQPILFGACHLAMKGAPAEAVAEALRKFVEVVVGEYASTQAEALVGDDE